MTLIFKKIKSFVAKRRFLSAEILGVVFLSLFIFVLSAKPASAQLFDITGFALDAFGKLIAWLIYLISQFLAFLITLASELLIGIINVGMTIPPAIKTGWGISLGITNTIFIFGLLYIAFATIFRIETYSAKKLIPTFLIVALLINFSFFFSQQIFGLSNDFAKSFLKLLGDPGAKIAQSTNLQSIWKGAPDPEKTSATPICVDKDTGANCVPYVDPSGTSDDTSTDPSKNPCRTEIKHKNDDLYVCPRAYWDYQTQARNTKPQTPGGIESFANMIIALLFNVVFMLIILFMLFAYVIFFIIRNIAIWTLIVLAPFAWAFMIFPKFKSHSSQWWDSFIKYCIFAPVALFFLYLATSMAGTFNNAVSANFNTQMAAGGFGALTLSNFMTVIIICGFGIAGLTVAQKLGIEGASTIKGWGDKAQKWATSKAKTRTQSILPGRLGAPARAQLALQKIERKEKGILGLKGKAAEAQKKVGEKIGKMEPADIAKYAGRRYFVPGAGYSMSKAARNIQKGKRTAFEYLRENDGLPKGIKTFEGMEKHAEEQRKKRKIREAKQKFGIGNKNKEEKEGGGGK